MKKLISSLFIILTLSGCGLFSKVSKNKIKEKNDISIESKVNIVSSITDSTKTTIKESVDTNIYLKPVKITDITLVNRLNDIKNLTVLSTDLYNIKQNYDSLSKQLQTILEFKGDSIPIKINKETIIQNSIKSNIIKDSISKIEDKSILKTEVKEKEPVNILPKILLGLVIIIILFFISKFIYKNYLK